MTWVPSLQELILQPFVATLFLQGVFSTTEGKSADLESILTIWSGLVFLYCVFMVVAEPTRQIAAGLIPSGLSLILSGGIGFLAAFAPLQNFVDNEGERYE